MKYLKKSFIGMALSLVLSVILFIPALADDGRALRVDNLSEAIPDADRDSFPANLHVLPGNRLFVVSERLAIYDLATLEELVSIPIPVPYDGKFDYSVMDRIQPLKEGFVWITERPDGGNFSNFFYYHFDDQLNILEETVLNERLPQSGASFVPDYRSLDIHPNGKEWYYYGTGDSSGLYKFHLDTNENSLVYRTGRVYGSDPDTIHSIRLIDNGKTVLMKTGRYGEESFGVPEYLLATINPDGTDLKVFESETFSDSFNLSASAYFGAIPPTAPVALAIPKDPTQEDPENYVLPPAKTVFVRSVENGEISEIPLNFSGEDGTVKLSESGAYLASIGSEDPYGEIHTIYIRVYDVLSGENLLNYELSDIGGYAKIINVSEVTRQIYAAYRQADSIYLIGITF